MTNETEIKINSQNQINNMEICINKIVYVTETKLTKVSALEAKQMNNQNSK